MIGVRDIGTCQILFWSSCQDGSFSGRRKEGISPENSVCISTSIIYGVRRSIRSASVNLKRGVTGVRPTAGT